MLAGVGRLLRFFARILTHIKAKRSISEPTNLLWRYIFWFGDTFFGLEIQMPKLLLFLWSYCRSRRAQQHWLKMLL